MTSPFIATANPPAKGTEAPVANDGWWPDVDCEKLRKDVRLDGTATPDRLVLAIEAAMWSTNRELADWQAEQIAAGHASLDAVPALTIGGESVKTKQYQRAINAAVQAELANAYRDIDTMPSGAGKESRVRTGLEIRVDNFLTQQRHAIADLLGKPRTMAALL